MRSARTPAIMVDIAHVILTRRARSISGQLLLDEDVLRTSGEIDFGRYQDGRDSNELRTDLFVED